MHKSVPFRPVEIIEEQFASYLIIQCKILSVSINPVIVYDDKPAFFRNLFFTLAALPGCFIISGDFNCTFHQGQDSSTGTDLSPADKKGAISMYKRL